MWRASVLPCVFEKVRVVKPVLCEWVDISGNWQVSCWRRRWEVSVQKTVNTFFSFVKWLDCGVLLAFRERMRAAHRRSLKRCAHFSFCLCFST